jgi:hypothetical protein
MFDVLYIPKMFTLQNRFHFREQKKVAGAKSGE